MVFVELGIEALLFARVDAQNGAKSLSCSGTSVPQAIRERYSTPRLRDPVQLLRASIVLTDPLFDIHEFRGPFLMAHPRAKGQRLASSRESNRLSTNTRIMRSSSCVEGKLAVKPCSYRPSLSYVLSRLCAPLTPHSCVQSSNSTLTDVTPNPCFLLRGVACSHKTREGGASACWSSF